MGPLVTSLSGLAASWRALASEPWVTEEVRAAFRLCADDLERTLRDSDNALLSPAEAARECGLAAATIRKKLADGVLPNEGKPYRPKVRRRVLRESMSREVARGLEVVR